MVRRDCSQYKAAYYLIIGEAIPFAFLTVTR